MQTEEEMFGFKCTYDDLSESEKKMYNNAVIRCADINRGF